MFSLTATVYNLFNPGLAAEFRCSVRTMDSVWGMKISDANPGKVQLSLTSCPTMPRVRDGDDVHGVSSVHHMLLTAAGIVDI